MTLLDEVKLALRVTTELTDGEVKTYIDTALFDMGNKGIKPSFLADDANDGDYMPIVKTAVVNYCKAQYGRDVEASERNANKASYASIVTALLNGKQNVWYEASDLSKGSVHRIPDQPHTGGELRPPVSVDYGKRRLRAGRDYEVSYSDNTEVGRATVTIEGKGAFEGTLTTHFEVV